MLDEQSMPMDPQTVLKELAKRPEFFRPFDYYDEAVQEGVVRCLRGRAIMLDSLMRRCESPLERLMFVALHWELTFSQLEKRPGGFFVIEPQHPLTANGRQYRLDFLVRAAVDGTEYKVDVECDGHEFHERTKGQAQRDRFRDRSVQAAGFRVFRFTGSEIYKDPYACAQEVANAILAMSGTATQDTV